MIVPFAIMLALMAAYIMVSIGVALLLVKDHERVALLVGLTWPVGFPVFLLALLGMRVLKKKRTLPKARARLRVIK